MIEKSIVDDFIEPYYRDKDIMHNMWHIELVRRQVDKIIAIGEYDVDRDILNLALAFHGFIYREEEEIRAFLINNGVRGEDIEAIIKTLKGFLQNNIDNDVFLDFMDLLQQEI